MQKFENVFVIFLFIIISPLLFVYGCLVCSILNDIWLGRPMKCLSHYTYVRIQTMRMFGLHSPEDVREHFFLDYPEEATCLADMKNYLGHVKDGTVAMVYHNEAGGFTSRVCSEKLYLQDKAFYEEWLKHKR